MTPEKCTLPPDNIQAYQNEIFAPVYLEDDDPEYNADTEPFLKKRSGKAIEHKKFGRGRRILRGLGLICIGTLIGLLISFLRSQTSALHHDHESAGFQGKRRNILLREVIDGHWMAKKHAISWIDNPDWEDNLLIERPVDGNDFLITKEVGRKNSDGGVVTKTLMKEDSFEVGERHVTASKFFPSKSLEKVLVATDVQSNWRHSFDARYWIFDVATQAAQPLDPSTPDGRVQLAIWSPGSNAIAFVRNNNIFLCNIHSHVVKQITTDGSPLIFYGVPDWVYEEEVFASRTGMWWSADGKYLSFLRTNDTEVPSYPIQYFVSRPSATQPLLGEESYPEVRNIRYPKVGAPNPTVELRFYDVQKDEIFEIRVPGEFEVENNIITAFTWAGTSALIHTTDRVSDVLKVVLVDMKTRTGKVIRTVDFQKLDGGWFEISYKTRYVPAGSGRLHDGYVDTVIYDNNSHLAYFTPLDNPDAIVLTSGDWEVINAPSAVNLDRNLVYFAATKESSIQRHIYSVKLDGSDLRPLTDTNKEGSYDMSFSSSTEYAIVDYNGPDIPWQKIISTPSINLPDPYESFIENNTRLAEMVGSHDLPVLLYSTVNISGYRLNVLERRPPHFDENKQYPVLFFAYGGPGSQKVTKDFNVDFQAFAAASLGYIVVTVDGRGTGNIGRRARAAIRDHIGFYEAHDQISTAEIWAQKPYVDASRLCIWGWSYGGFVTLKTLELDAGRTFSYGMAVAPVTDWRFYDSIHTERYMHTLLSNAEGYESSAVTNATALGANIRFLIMHGVADDNVHLQNTLALLDQLDLAGVENYDVHVFPDSDHSISFHNANEIVYDKLSNWLINAFNGEWLRTMNAVPKPSGEIYRSGKERDRKEGTSS